MNNIILNLPKEPVLQLGSLSFLLLLLSLPFAFWSASISKRSSVVTFLIAITNLLITTQLTLRWFESGHFPISNLYESLCFLAWSITLIQLILERLFNYPLVQSFLSPFSLIVIAFASFILPDELQSSSALVPALRSNWLVMHVTVIMLSYAALITGSLLSAIVLFFFGSESIQIRGSSFGVGSYKTNLEDQKIEVNNISSSLQFTNPELLDNLSYRVITVGFLLLTFGLISGAVWANEAWGTWWSWDPKETWAFITWLVYAGYLHSRITKGWQGKKPALIALLGLFIIFICYLGVNLLGVGLHSYGWFL